LSPTINWSVTLSKGASMGVMKEKDQVAKPKQGNGQQSLVTKQGRQQSNGLIQHSAKEGNGFCRTINRRKRREKKKKKSLSNK